MNLLTRLRAVSSVGLSLSLRALANTLRKERQDRRYRTKIETQAVPVLPGRLLNAEKFPAGAKFHFESGRLEIRFLATDLARISWEPGAPPPPYAIARQDQPPVLILLRPEAEGYILESETLGILV